MSSLCDLWLSQSVGVKWLGTWQIPLSNYSKSLKRYSKGMNLLFINSQLYIDLLCTPSALALVWITNILPAAARVIKVNENMSLFCWFLMVSCHASNMPNWFPPPDFHAGSLLCLECFSPGVCKPGFLICLGLSSNHPSDCPSPPLVTLCLDRSSFLFTALMLAEMTCVYLFSPYLFVSPTRM